METKEVLILICSTFGGVILGFVLDRFAQKKARAQHIRDIQAERARQAYGLICMGQEHAVNERVGDAMQVLREAKPIVDTLPAVLRSVMEEGWKTAWRPLDPYEVEPPPDSPAEHFDPVMGSRGTG